MAKKTKPKVRSRRSRSRGSPKGARSARKTTRSARKTTRSPRKVTRGSRKESGALAAVRDIRSRAKRALDRLNTEIEQTRSKLERLVDAEETFRRELTGAATGTRTRRAPAPRRTRRRKPRRRAKATRPRGGRPRAEKYFEKLPTTFTLDDVRKLAGSRAGVSIAQWSRSSRIRKVGGKYKKVG